MTEEFKEINERIWGAVAVLAFVIFLCLACYYKNIVCIVLLACYSVWFGSYINDLGRRANIEKVRMGQV